MSGDILVAATMKQQVHAWEDAHAGWHLDRSQHPWTRLADPSGAVHLKAIDLGGLLKDLVAAELRVETEREQLALLKAEHPDESIVVCDGTWESTRHGIQPVTAPEAWLLNLLLQKIGR